VTGPQGPQGPEGAASTVAGPQGPQGPSGPAGANAEPSQVYADLFTGTGACTVFTLSSNSTTNTVYVFLNGVAQVPNTDYTVSNNLLTFTNAPENNTNVDVRVFGNVSIVAGSGGGSGTTVTRDEYSGDGANTDFTLSTTPTSEDYTIVFVDSVLQRTDAYNVATSTLSFNLAPEANAEIDVITISGGGGDSGITVSQNGSNDIVSNTINFINTSTVTVETSNNSGVINVAFTSTGGGGITTGKAIAMSIVFGG
jgi:hypothetical protein